MGKGSKIFTGVILLIAGFALRYMFDFVTGVAGSGAGVLPFDLGSLIQAFSLILLVVGAGIIAMVLVQIIFRVAKKMVKRDNGKKRKDVPYSERIERQRYDEYDQEPQDQPRQEPERRRERREGGNAWYDPKD